MNKAVTLTPSILGPHFTARFLAVAVEAGLVVCEPSYRGELELDWPTAITPASADATGVE